MKALATVLSIGVAIVASVSGTNHALAAAPIYSIVGHMPDGKHGPRQFEDVNSLGDVVGDMNEDRQKAPKATYSHGVLTKLPQSDRAYRSRMNARGDVVTVNFTPNVPDGRYVTLYAGGVRTRLFKMADFGGINEKGQVVGTTHGLFRPVIYDDGVYHRLPTLHGEQGRANAINNAGVVVGSNMKYQRVRPAIWDTRKSVRFLGNLKDVGIGHLFDINNRGEMVGCTDVLGCFLYDGKRVTAFPPLNNVPWNYVHGISDDGIVLGKASYINEVVYCLGKSYWLTNLIDGDERGRWRQLEVNRISRAGHIIGKGLRDGVPMNFIATLTSPCTVDR